MDFEIGLAVCKRKYFKINKITVVIFLTYMFNSLA